MKNQIRMMALLVVLGLTAVSCTKENVFDGISDIATSHSAIYIIEGQHYYANPQTEEEWSAFLDHMFALAEEGYMVRFMRSDVQMSLTKEKLTYTTGDLSDAKEWCRQKLDEGYDVTMTFDQQTGQYICIAIK